MKKLPYLPVVLNVELNGSHNGYVQSAGHGSGQLSIYIVMGIYFQMDHLHILCHLVDMYKASS